MFFARCAGISLALFLLIYIPLSLAVSRGWVLLLQRLQPTTARKFASLLFGLRILPFGLASIFTLGFTLPSFLLLEPHSTDEAIGTAPLALGLCCLALLIAGGVRAASAQMKTSRALMKWLDGSTIMDPGAAVPVFRTGKNSPSLTVAGVCEPKVLVSEAAIAALTAAELRTALKHEVAHARAYDNLKKLLFRFSAFPGMTMLEGAWSEQSELAADDAAVACFQDALDLAGALIKVSRLGAGNTQTLLATGLLHSSTALGARVQRLMAWEKKPVPAARSRHWRYSVPAMSGFMFLIVTTYGSVLTGLHELTEWLVR